MTHWTMSYEITVAQAQKLDDFLIMLFDTKYDYNPPSGGQTV